MLTASVENMLVSSIGTKLETGVVSTLYILIISTVRRQSEIGIQRWIDFGLIVNFCLSTSSNRLVDYSFPSPVKSSLGH